MTANLELINYGWPVDCLGNVINPGLPIGGNDSFTKLLLHMDGADASTTFTDSSSAPHTVTANGNAQIDTAQSKFGGASGLFDGTGDYLSSADNADWDMGAGSFTVDFWVRFNSVAANVQFYTQDNAGNTDRSLTIQWLTSNLFYVLMSSDGTNWADILTFAWTPSTNTWYHVAITKSGTSVRVFIDGTQIGATQTATVGTIRNSTSELRIGIDSAGGSALNGWLDEYRISKGIARWTANFGVPIFPYTS